MKTLILIPARMASLRFPNKPMALICGKPMIQRVWEQAMASNLGEVIVACSEKEVLECIMSLGGKAVLTDPNLPSGTDRIFEAIKNKDNIFTQQINSNHLKNKSYTPLACSSTLHSFNEPENPEHPGLS